MAAGQVSDAFARISSTHDDMERISKEFHESKHAHAKLTKEHDRILTELEMTRTALLQAEKDVEGNKKDIEEITAARKAAQEGQNAAIDQLMKQLNELGAVAVVENNEVESGKLQVTILENKALHEQLLQSNTAVRELQERCSDLQKHLLDVEQGDKRLQEKKIVKIEALDGSNVSDAYERDSLIKDIYELKFQNEYLKLHLEHFCADIIQSGSTEDAIVQFKESSQGNHSYTVSQLHREITDLSKQLEESRASLAVAEDNIKQFHLAISQSDERVQELSTQLVEDHKNMENQIKERDEKFAELDLKFGRLQKRAKQRIQELQKEKDDIEAQLSIARDKASQAMIQQSEIKQELERVRHETGEALRSIDGEKQRLHIANSRQKEIIDDLHRALESKEHTLEELKHSLSEKDQVLQETQNSLKLLEEKNQASLLELSAKNQKIVESFESQLADATLESRKLTESIAKQRAQLADRESKLAELEATSTGEVARLRAALEAAKGDVIRIKQEQLKEKESWDAELQKMKTRLEESEKSILQYEIDAVKTRSQLELELEGLQQKVDKYEEALASAREEFRSLEKEFKAYKNRAHALLQKKEAELLAVKDMELVAAQEAALKEAQREAALASAEKDWAKKALQDAVRCHETELAARSVALMDAEERIKDMATKLESLRAHLVSEKEEWQTTIMNVEETWRLKYKALEAEAHKASTAGLDDDIHLLKTTCEKIKEEYESFQEMAKNMIEEKDKEIVRLLDDNSNLRKSLQSKQQVEKDKIREKQDTSTPLVAGAEHQILLLARQQAQREEELARCQRHIQALQEEIDELKHENQLRIKQEIAIKDEFRNMERERKRDGVDMTYLKNVILKLLETGEVEALLPVVGTLLQFSPEEIRKCQETYRSAPDVPLSGGAAVVDAASSAPRSLFSRFTFS
ncbi:protein GRIP isoform X2 [Cryptomeria japonica]|nr:protein GRIP isoform X2 [Cryptomeria japonica]